MIPSVPCRRSLYLQAQGSLGSRCAGKEPIRDENGQDHRVVSVGYLVRDIDADLQGYLRFGPAATLLIVVLNSVAAAWLARRCNEGDIRL